MPITQELPGGNFGQATGGSSALREAFQERGVSTSVLDQLTPGAPAGASPVPQDPANLQAAQQALPADTGPAPTPQAPPPPPTDPELMSAIDALGGFVKSGGQTRRDLAKARVQGIV